MCKHPNRRRPTQPRPRPVDLEIDRVERIDSTRLKIDRLDRSTRLASHCLQACSFFAAQLQLSSVFFIVMSVCQSQPCTVNCARGY